MDPCCPPGWGVLVAACTHGMGLGDPNTRWPRANWARGAWPGVAAGCVGWRYGGAWLGAAPWPPFLPLPLLPPGLQLRARARGVKIVQQQPPAPARRGEGVCSSLHVPSTGTSQNSHGDRGAGALQPPQTRGTGPAQLPAGPLGACSPRPPPALSSPPNPRGTGLWVLPRTPVFGASSAARGEPPAATTVGLGTASPSSPEPGSSVLPSLLPLHHPSSAPISIGGKRLPPGPGAPRGPRERLEPPVLAGRTGLSPPPPAAQHLFPEPHLTTMLFSSCFFSCRFHMGNLLKVLTYNELDQGPNFFLDFESEMGFLFSFSFYLL